MQRILECYPGLKMDDVSASLEAAILNANIFGKWAVREETS